MIKKEAVDLFLQQKNVAVAGVSRNPKKFGFMIFNEMKKGGFNVYPVNPNASDIEGTKCYNNIADVPDDVASLVIATAKTETEKSVESAIQKGIKHIWIQQNSQTPKAIETAEKAGVNLVYKECIFMFIEPVSSVHKFHRFINKVFGKYPK
jgi:uncharacterized protein